MKKAKEYVEILKGKEQDFDLLAKTVHNLVLEADELVLKRKCNQNSAYLSVFKEIAQKWRSICCSLPSVPKNAFSIAIKIRSESIYNILVREKVLEPV